MSNYVEGYYRSVCGYMKRIMDEEKEHMDKAAQVIADQIKKDKLVYIWGPGGHSNMAAMEVFYRAGGIAYFSAILDEGTLLSNGAERSTKIERLPGYGAAVVNSNDIGEGDLLIVANSYGINSATIDAALEARRLGAKVIGISSVEHAQNTPKEHPARHPSKKNLHEVVDYHVDTKIPGGDALVQVEGASQPTGALSTFANSFTLQSIVIQVVEKLAAEGMDPPLWKSGNASGGDEWNQKFFDRFRGKIRYL